MAIKIEWHRLQNSAEGDRLAFEHFCHHILLRYFRNSGIERKYYNTPGAESYIEIKTPILFQGISLQAGDVIGWQAKFWLSKSDEGCSPLNEKHRNELVSGFKKANVARENIKLWILCTPGDFATKPYDTLLKEFAVINKDCTIVPWSKSDFEYFYINERDKYSGIYQYYFDGQFVGIHAIDAVTKDTLEKLREKYDVELHVPSDMERILMPIIDANKARHILQQRIETIVEEIENDKKKNGLLDAKSYKKTKLTSRYIQSYNKRLKALYTFAEDISVYASSRNLLDELSKISLLIERYITNYSKIQSELDDELKKISKKNENAELPAPTHVLVSPLVERIFRMERNITKYSEDTLNIVELVNLLLRKTHAIFAEPGNGKTHLACSLADNLLQNTLPALLILGSDFRSEKTMAQILIDKLGMASNPSLDELFDMFEFIGESHQSRMPIIIDGLNEADPHSAEWRNRLPEIERRVNERNHVMLITTCRSQREYLRTIYNKEDISHISNSYELGYMEPESVEKMVKKYFKKYAIQPKEYSALEPFKHPLLLKIFCDVNKGEKDLDISDTPLTKCIQEYSRRMIAKIADTSSRGYEKRRHDIKTGLGKVSQMIWDTNVRTMRYVPDFYEQFTEDEYAEKIIDEGCFSTEVESDVPYVHFTYDMIAGYHIAQKIIDSYLEKDKFITYIKENQYRLFGSPRHTYSEDIIRSLVYLIPQVYHEQWSDMHPIKEVETAMMGDIDAVRTTEGGAKAVHMLMTSGKLDSAQKEMMCENLYRKVCVNRTLSHVSEYLALFVNLHPMEIDQYWNSRFVGYSELERMRSILHDDYVVERYEWDDIISCDIMMCGIVDTEYRELYHRLMFDHVLHHFDAFNHSILKRALRINDPFIKESVLAVMTGVALRMDAKEIVDEIIQMLEAYMNEYASNSVFLLDALDTLYRYRAYRWQGEYNKELLEKNKSEQWPISQGSDTHMYGIFDYDFDKFNLRPLYESPYRPIIDEAYTREEVFGMLQARCQKNGCDETICGQLGKDAYEKAQYRSNQRKTYGYKHGRFAASELYGWLIVNGRLRPAYRNTYRVEFMDIDPSMPSMPAQWTWVNKSFMPESRDDLEDWMGKDDMNVMEEQFVRSLPRYEGEWVMLHGQYSQHVSEKYADYYQAGCVEIDSASKDDEAIKSEEMTEPSYYGHKYAGEIGWRILELREDEWDMDEDKRILADYSFTSWSENRYKYTSFICLKTEVAIELGLRFDVNTMAYYDNDGNIASVYYANGTDQFFYLRKDIVERLLVIKKACIRLHIYERRMIDSLPSGIKAPKKTYVDQKKDVIYRWPIAQEEK